VSTTSTFTDETGSHKVEEIAQRHPSIVTAARLGWAAKGVVYTVLGVLAFQIARQGLGGDPASGRDEASQTGAVAEIADTSFGVLALWLVAVGLALYVVWRVISILLPAENRAGTWVTRAGYLVSAVVYSVLAWVALSFARQTRTASGGEDAKVERLTRDLMEMSGGRLLVGAIGIIVIGVGLYFGLKGLRASFRDELEPGGVGPISSEGIVTLGRVGWVGRGIVMVLVGWFVTRAAIEFRPDEAQGIDGALRQVTGSTIGALLVGLAAVALVVYGVFCVISARRARLTGAD
jgi:Domain of Unknown Function (DUF1206)